MTTDSNIFDQVMDVYEASKVLGIGPARIRMLCDQNKLTAKKVNKTEWILIRDKTPIPPKHILDSIEGRVEFAHRHNITPTEVRKMILNNGVMGTKIGAEWIVLANQQPNHECLLDTEDEEFQYSPLATQYKISEQDQDTQLTNLIERYKGDYKTYHLARILNVFRRAGIKSVGDLGKYSRHTLSNQRNFGIITQNILYEMMERTYTANREIPTSISGQ